MRVFILFVFSVLLFFSCNRPVTELTSPDKDTKIVFYLDEQGIPWYQLIRKNDTLCEPSRLGINIENNPMDSGLNLISSELFLNKLPFNYALNAFHEEEDPFNEMVVKVSKNGQEMDIVFRAYDCGVAIRYWLRGYQNVILTSDMTELRFRSDVMSFWAPEHTPYEKNSYYRSPLSTIQEVYKEAHPSEYKFGRYPDSIFLALPLLVDNGRGCLMNFQQVTGSGGNSFAFRLDPEQSTIYTSVMNNGFPRQVVTLPYYSPWLAIGLSKTSESLLESKMIYHLAIEEETPIEPENHPIRLFENNCNNNVILPFSRHYDGAREYPLLNIEHGAHSTLVHQLALHVVFNRPISVYNDYVDSISDKAKLAYQFVRELPSEWSEMKVIDSKLSKYVIVARKDANSNNWFIAGISDGSKRELSVMFDFLDEGSLYKGVFYEDGLDADWLENPNSYKIEEAFVRKNNTFSFELGYGGGFALILREVKNP